MSKVQTSRFGEITIEDKDIINIAEGLFGFESLTKFFIVDPEDNTFILWLQSAKNPNIAFPIIEPQVFYPMFEKKFIAPDLKSLEIQEIKEAKYYSIVTIPKDLTLMSANLKAPILINPKNQKGRQIVLQDSKLPVNLPIYKTLRAYLSNSQTQKQGERSQVSV